MEGDSHSGGYFKDTPSQPAALSIPFGTYCIESGAIVSSNHGAARVDLEGLIVFFDGSKENCSSTNRCFRLNGKVRVRALSLDHTDRECNNVECSLPVTV